ncbi:MAG: DUF1559 domain-containing protein [Planctomycetaceae bacterium]|nr:DUF1559 domain-containing protein [Planctomycetaceae bacterium]
MRPQRHPRSGVTLVELMVVLGLITALMALLLPAVQSARGSARLMQCRNNLHQIGIATHNFHAFSGKLPFSLQPLRKLLPNVEQQGLYDAMEDEANIGAWFTTPSVYLCPDDSYLEPSHGNVSYFLNGGSAIAPPNGPFEVKSIPTRTFRDFTDGLSTTALFSERLQMVWRYAEYPSVEAGRQNPLRYLWQTPLEFVPGQERELAAWCMDQNNQSQAVYPTGVGHFGSQSFPGEGSWYNHIVPPNNWAFINGPWPDRGPYPATSLHPGGVNVLMADGAVVFVSSNIGFEVWWALGSRASGDVVGEF